MSRPVRRNSGVADLRGFRYHLEPLGKRVQWELDGLYGQLAKVQRQLTLARSERDATIVIHTQESERLGREVMVRVDPSRYQAGLLYLAQLQSVMAEGARQIEELEKARKHLVLSCQVCETKLEGLRAHESSSLDSHILDQTRLRAAEADSDWIMRNAFRKTLTRALPEIGAGT